MTALVNISADNVHAIKEGLNDLGNALLSIHAIEPDSTTIIIKLKFLSNLCIVMNDFDVPTE